MSISSVNRPTVSESPPPKERLAPSRHTFSVVLFDVEVMNVCRDDRCLRPEGRFDDGYNKYLDWMELG